MHKSISSLIFAVLTLEIALGQVAFPEKYENTDKKKQNLAGRIPLFSPARCGKHELLYPGDQANDWICDCAPAHLYYPDTETCYPAFRQGPCNDSEYLILHTNKVIPECIPNGCKTDGQVSLHGVCYALGRSAPCRNPELSYVLGVNATTLQVDCIRVSISVAMRFGDDEGELEGPVAPNYDLATIDQCARGTKRSIEGHCSQNN